MAYCIDTSELVAVAGRCPTDSGVATTGTGMQVPSNRHQTHAAGVVDLAPLASACRDLVDWYDELIAGSQPPIARLDRVITTLQSLPNVGGRIGRDIDLIVAGGAHHTHDEIIGAVERLRSLANHQPTSPTTEPPQSSTPRRLPRGRTPSQAPLPGFGLTGQGGLE